MSSKVSLCAVFMIYQGRVKAIVQGKTLYDFTKFNNCNYHYIKLTPFPMLHRMGYSSLSVIALVYDPIFL